MGKLIQNRRVATDNWLLLKLGEDKSLPAVPAAGDVIVPLALWQRDHEALAAREGRVGAEAGGRVGVWIDSGEAWEAAASNLLQRPLIALNFPKFGDGRNLSTARLLRERHGYRGEIRAVGDVIRDLLRGMQRCGIDSYLLRDDQEPDDALQAFDELPEVYQASVETPLPLFRRRAA